MPSDPDSYRRALTDLYLRLPDTPRRLSRFDLRLVRQLCDRQIPLTVVETAFLLASARRIHRPADAPTLGPIRSLYYFLPIIEELFENPVPQSGLYLAYLRSKITLRPAPSSSPPSPG
jgi:hypothetical protein